MIRIVGGANVGTGNDFPSIISENKVCKDIAFIFSDPNPGALLFSTIRRESTFSLVQNRFPPMELEERRNIALDAGGFFNGSDAANSVRRHVIQKEDNIEEA